ncbi:MAG: hypothetical protein KatS3mg102_2318 [Planctomycetota bacterium]|nr:MAG: hypothetical protein KatS3mg102_2318 [Planctomycetota bacterium]
MVGYRGGGQAGAGGGRAGRAALRAAGLAAGVLALAAAAWAEPREYAIDPAASRFEVHTGTAGLLGGLAHEHTVRAGALQGRVRWDPAAPEQAEVEVTVQARALIVADEGIEERTRQQIAETMRREVLEVERYPLIRFRSRRVVRVGEQLRVSGWLELHGVRREVVVPVALAELPEGALLAEGEFRLRQSEFGIEPYSTALGTIAVADEVAFRFRAVLRARAR